MYKLLIILSIFAAGCSSLRYRYHEVRSGETLDQIAQKYGVPSSDLTRHNEHVGAAVRKGEKLYIPFEKSAGWNPSGELAGGGSKAEGLRALRGISSASPASYFAWPVNGRVSSTFGRRRGKSHEGVDIVAPHGTTVKASQGGVVSYRGSSLSGYGNMVILQHSNGFTTVYGHLSKINVQKGQKLSRGDRLGAVGQTGRAKGAHLHFEVRYRHQPVDPMDYLQGRYAANTN